MSDLISRSEVVNIAKGFNFTFKDDKKRYMDFLDYCLNNAPTIEAVPVVHGRWIFKNDGAYGQRRAYCSVCGKRSGIGGIESNQRKPFCPNCGAKMEE